MDRPYLELLQSLLCKLPVNCKGARLAHLSNFGAVGTLEVR